MDAALGSGALPANASCDTGARQVDHDRRDDAPSRPPAAADKKIGAAAARNVPILNNDDSRRDHVAAPFRSQAPCDASTAHFMNVLRKEAVMSKAQDARKSEKKVAVKTPKEKKDAKKLKKEAAKRQ
ncbi:hypothetical protein [Burkholderia sp. 3C]